MSKTNWADFTPIDDAGAPVPAPAPATDWSKFEPIGGQNKGLASDALTAVKQGVQQLPGIATGLADIPMGLVGVDRPFSKVADALGTLTGFQPGKWAKEANSEYSPETQVARSAVDQAWSDPGKGAMDVASAYLQNPRTIGLTAIQSVPSMVAGGLLGRGVGLAAGIGSAAARAAIGEGAVMAGGAMDQIDKGVDPQRAAAASLATGIGGAAVSAAGAKIASRLGNVDIDSAIAGGATAPTSSTMSLAKRVPAGILQEGLLEEAPQSALETGAQNWAEGKPLTEGMARNVTEGALAGGLMGGGAAAMTRQTEKPAEAPAAAPTPPALGFNPKAGTHTVFPDGTVILNSDTPAGEQAVFDKRFAPQPSDATTAATARVLSELAAIVAPLGITPTPDAEANPQLPKLAAWTDLNLSLTLEHQLKKGAQVNKPLVQGLANEIARRAVAPAPAAAPAAAPVAAPAPTINPADLPDAGTPMPTTPPLPPVQSDPPVPTIPPSPPKPSEAMGLDPAIGSLTAAAAIAVDGPAAATVAAAAEAQATQEAATKTKKGDANVSNADAPGALAARTGGSVGVDATGGRPDAGLLGLDGGRDGAGSAGSPSSTVSQGSAASVPGQRIDTPLSPAAPTAKRATDAPTISAKVGGLKDFMAKKKAEREAANVQDQAQGAAEAARAPTQPEADQTAPAVGRDRAAQPGAAPAGNPGVEAAGVAPNSTDATGKQASWVIRNKATGEVVMETFDRAKVEALNTAKYEAVPVQEHLASLNKKPAPQPTPTEPTSEPQADQTQQGSTKQPQAPAGAAAAEVAQAANEAATSPANDLPEPTQAQKEAGNYKKGHVQFDGLDLTVENPVGSTRSGTDPNGKPWKVTMTAHYGYHKRTTGADGDQVDVYLARDPRPGSPVFVFDQFNADGAFDEHKAVAGVATEAEAIAIYDAHFSDGSGPKRRRTIKSMTPAEFKAWAASDAAKQPLSQSVIDPATRDNLKAIAERLGVAVNERNGGFASRAGEIDIPPMDKQVEGALSPEHVFAHELGHAAMNKRGISFAGAPVAQIKRWAPNWDDLVAASKAYRPAVWGNPDVRIKNHVRKPNEVLADAIGSVYLGLNDVSLLKPFMDGTGTTMIDLGLEAAPSTATATPQEITHNGTRLYRTRAKLGDEVKTMWAVESADNKTRRESGERTLGGDSLHDTLDQAKAAADREAKEFADRKTFAEQQDAADRARREADEAKKEANRGKSILERRKDAILDGDHKFPASAGLGTGSRRQAMQMAVEQGRAIVERQVDDTAAKKRDNDAIDRVKRSGYMLGLSNENIPVVKAGLEAQARLKANDYKKPEYRVYAGSEPTGPFFEITKTEFEYAQELMRVQRVMPKDGKWMDAPNERPRWHSTQPEAKELAAGPVVRAAVKPAEWPSLGVSKALESLLALKSTKLILDDGRGRRLYDVTVSVPFRAKNFVNGRMPIGEGLELKEKAQVTGNAYDNGYVLIDNREQLASRQPPAAAEQKLGAAPATGTRRDPTKVSMFNPYNDGDIVTIDGQDWTVKTDTPGWYLTTTGNWRGQHPTIRNVKAMADLIREVEQAATAPAPAATKQKELSAEDLANLDKSLLDGVISVQDYMDATGLTDDDVGVAAGDGLRQQADREAKAADSYYQGIQKMQDALSDQMKAALDAPSSTPQQRKSKEERMARITRDRATLDMIARGFEHPFDNRFVTKLSPMLKARFTKQWESIKTGEFAKQAFQEASYKLWAQKVIDKAREKLGMAVEPTAPASALASQWDAMTEQQREAVAIRAGWSTAKGGPNFIAKRLVKQAWSEITPGTQATLSRFAQAATVEVPAPTPAKQPQTNARDRAAAETPAPAAPASRITDFGEKIGGAKKDMWTGFKDDLTAVADDDIAGQPLSKVWPAPDYQALIDGGASPEVIAFVRAARDEVPAKPRVAYKVKGWAIKVRTLRGMAVDLMTGKLTMPEVRAQLEKAGALSRSMQGFMGRVELYQAVGHAKSLDGISMAWHNYTIYRGQKDVSMWVVEKEAAATAFGNWPRELATGKTMEEAIEAFRKAYDKLDSDKEAKKGVQFDIISFRGENGYWIAKKLGRNHIKVHGPLATVKEAREYRDQNQADLVAKLEKIKEIPNERRDTNEPRVGEDMRGGANVTPELFSDTFGFKGVEFGNWVEQGRRQQDLNNAFDALMDMAAVLGIPPRAISLNGQLGLAFGARGSGGAGLIAAAHYEPDKVVINLTKKNGAGSLGHEWWHAVDNYFAKMRKGQGGEFMTTARDVLLASRDAGYAPYAGVRPEMVKAFGNVVKAINLTDMKKRASVLDGKRSKEYWTTGEELSARAFEAYLISKLQDQNASNDYLANIVDEKVWNAAAALGLENENSYPYPVAKEVPGIRAGFDQFFQTVQTKEDDAGNVAMFRSTTTSLRLSDLIGKPLSVEETENTAQSILKRVPNAPKVEVHRSPADIGISFNGEMPKGGTLPDGRIVIFADANTGRLDVMRTVFHELFHRGLKSYFNTNQEYVKFMLDLASKYSIVRKGATDWRNTEDGRAKWAEFAKKGPMTGERLANYEALAAEESLATLSETLRAGSPLQLRTWTRSIGNMVEDVARFFGMEQFARWVHNLNSTPLEDFVNDVIDRSGNAPRGGTSLMLRTDGKAVDQTETEAFRRWFADSKVVDADGKPMVVYHGTSADITVFDEAKSRYGFWFSADSADAEDYGGNTVEAYLSLKNPAYFERISGDKGVNDAIAKAKSDGHDGLIVTAPEDGDTNGMYWPTNYVAFRPEQIKSAIGNNGQFDPNNPDIRFRSTARDLTAKATEGVNATIKAMTVTNIKQAAGYKATDLMGIALGALGRRQLVEIYGNDLPLDKYNELATQMEADKNEYGAEADAIATEWGKLKDEGALANIMHDATLAQIDPDKPLQPRDDPAAYNALKMRFNLMSKEAKETYRKARDGYKRHHSNVREAIKERIERSQMSPERRASLIERMDSEFFSAIKGVYFPLARFGKYVVVVRNAQGMVENVSRAETMAEAAALRQSLLRGFPQAQGYDVGKVILSREFVASRDSVGRGFMQELYQAMDKQDMDPAMRAEMEDTLGQLYLSSLPDVSWAKHGIHRKGTPGFSQDARRAFAQNMFHGARYLAKLRYSDLMQNELKAMQDHVDKIGNVLPEEDGFNGPRMQRVVDEFYKRHDSLMNPNSHPLSTALTSIGFMFHLGLSPASALVNMTQTAFVAYPVMAAKWGFGKAGVALLKASKQAAMGKNDITKFLNRDERRAYDEAVRAGTIDVTMAHDLAGIAQGEDAGVMWKIRPAMRAASFLFHHAERFNRQVTFVAAYRLARETGAAHEAAFEQATKATYDGHFDYSAGNRPRFMQGNAAKVLLLFKQYGQNMVYTLARNGYQAVNAVDPAERAQARKALAGVLATHAMAAGVLGLPMVTTILAAISAAGGDDDEPFDAEVALKNMLADTFGTKAAEVMAHGLSRLTPWDISGRVGLDRLILPDIQEGLEGQRLAESAMAAALGPVAGIVVNMLRGLQDIGNGHVMRGIEGMMPAALRGPMASLRLASEGSIDKTGVPIVDEVGVAGVVGQALGFSPSEVRQAQAGKRAILGYDRSLNERRQELMTQFARGAMSQDQVAMDEARAEIRAFNEKHPQRRITMPQLAQSIRSRQQRINRSEGGVSLPANRRDAMGQGRFADVE